MSAARRAAQRQSESEFGRQRDSNVANTQRGRALVALRKMLLAGTVPRSKRLEEIDLGRQLMVSRPVLRSILEELLSEGLLEPATSGGYAVRQFTLDDIRDAILARSSLEGLAAGLAAKRLRRPSELDKARKLNAELGAAAVSRAARLPTLEELSRFGDLNAAFHSAVVEMAHSPMLSWCIERLQSLAFASPAAVVLPAGGGGARRAFEEHEAILNAIEARDAALAEELFKQHANVPIRSIESALAGQVHASRNIALALVGRPRRAIAEPELPRKRKGEKVDRASGPTSERILGAAADLFCEKGFYAATTRELATRLNIQQASLYHHVPNKEELLHRICRDVADAFLDEGSAALKKSKHGRDRINGFLDAHLRTIARFPRPALALVTEFRALSRPHFAEISAKCSEYSRLLEAEVKSVQTGGRARADIPAKCIRLALLNILSWTPRWFQPDGALSAKELSSIYQRVLWKGVVNPNLAQIPSIGPLPAIRRRRRELHRGTLGKFIRAAAEMFARHGYHSTSTRNLATLLGMEKATLYYHVEGKEDLLYAICKSSIEQLAGDVSEAVEGIQEPLEQLQVWIQAHVASLLRDQTQHATSLAEARALSPDRLAEIVKMGKAYRSRIRSLIEAGQKAGCFRTDIAPKYLGQMLEGLLDHTVVWFRRSGEFSPSEWGVILCKLFVAGVQRR
jgi:DNA-binding GntR family transcriptional regulator/AcrR family transcriptional regulator